MYNLAADRPAARFLNYKGDVTDSVNPEKALGPTAFGEPVWPVIATYDPETNMTRVGFSYIAPKIDDSAVTV